MSVVLQKHAEMNSVQACKCMWAMATLRADNNRPVVAALSQKWRTELVHQASVLDNTQFLWALGTLGSRSNDRVYAECLNDLLLRIRQQISQALRDSEDIDRCLFAIPQPPAPPQTPAFGLICMPHQRLCFLVSQCNLTFPAGNTATSWLVQRMVAAVWQCHVQVCLDGGHRCFQAAVPPPRQVHRPSCS